MQYFLPEGCEDVCGSTEHNLTKLIPRVEDQWWYSGFVNRLLREHQARGISDLARSKLLETPLPSTQT